MANKLPIFIINKGILFKNVEFRSETNLNQDKEVLNKIDDSKDKNLIVIHSLDNISTTDVTQFPKIGLLATLTLKLNIPNSITRYIIIGVKRVEITNYEEKNGIYYATYQEIKTPLIAKNEEKMYLDMLYRNYERYVREIASVSNAMLSEFLSIKSLDDLTDFIVSFLNLSPDIKKEYLYELNPIERSKKLISQLKEEIKLAKLEKEIEQKVHKDIDENQREYYLQEQMKIISKELGTASSKDKIVEKYKNKLKRLKASPKIKAKIKEEIDRFINTNQSSPDASMIRDYIDLMLSLPWDYKTKDTKDLKEIEKSLNSSHYGLDEIKTRIIEYLAVKQNAKKEKGPILCFIGPPGVGKTSLAKSIAKSLNKNLATISVGGINDEAEIVGHRRTYIGAMPGKIIQGLKKCGSSNPVFVIDEIDKMTKNIKGDPASSLLEVLDKEQNYRFSDHYVDEDYDLSEVFFIATANYEENIPPELKDRLEIIHLDSYTEYEKLEIAKNYLIPKLLEEHGLTSLQVEFEDQAILDIINYYTKEAGVRSLERLISKILRKIVRKLLSDNEVFFYHIDFSDLKTYLGDKIYIEKESKEKDLKGVVNGLAYTFFGGDILSIETIHYQGSSSLLLTGSLGNIMKESAQIALSYIKAHQQAFKIPLTILKDDIHIHVPSGSIPKEGPSAGITLTTSIISAFTGKKVSSKIAMTGELTLTGEILAVGGIKEKVLGAYRNGIKTIYLPSQNKKDLKDIPDNIKDKIAFIFIKDYQELYTDLFERAEEKVCN